MVVIVVAQEGQAPMTLLQEFIAAGKELHANEKYDDALVAYQKALPLARSVSPSMTLEVLDRRVAAHLKLGNLSNAEEEARSMIRTNKADGRGYLRCGQIKRLGGQIRAAAEWYGYGLKQVARSDCLHAYIDTQLHGLKQVARSDYLHAYIDTQLHQVRETILPRKDPFAVLPAELIQQILLYVDYKDAVRALAVSKSWAKQLLIMRPILDTIDIKTSKSPVTYSSMRAALKRTPTSAKAVRVENLSDQAAQYLRSNLERWIRYTELQDLSITSAIPGISFLPFAKYRLSDLQLTSVHTTVVVRILKTCKSLVNAKFHRLSHDASDVAAAGDTESTTPIAANLRSLVLGFSDGMLGYQMLHTLLPRISNLREITISQPKLDYISTKSCDLSQLQHLQRVAFHNLAFNNLQLPPSISSWQNYTCDFGPMSWQTTLDFQHLSALQVFRAVECNCTLNLSSLIGPGTNAIMTHLDLTKSFLNNPTAFDWEQFLSGALRNLKDLRLCGRSLETHRWVNPAASNPLSNLVSLRCLEELRLSSCSVTAVHLADMIRSSNCRLLHIHLTDCEKVSADIVKLAEMKNIKVTIKKTQIAGARILC